LTQRGKLICWCETPDNKNHCSVIVNAAMITTDGVYRALYFVKGSENPLGGSNNFFPEYLEAEINLLRSTRVKDAKLVEITPHQGQDEVREDTCGVCLKCGVDVVLEYNVKHSEGHIHGDGDCTALLKDDGEMPNVNNALQIIKLVPGENSGEIEVDNLCSLPGVYRLYYFCKVYGNRVCGKSGDILASLDFGGTLANSLMLKRKNRGERASLEEDSSD